MVPSLQQGNWYPEKSRNWAKATHVESAEREFEPRPGLLSLLLNTRAILPASLQLPSALVRPLGATVLPSLGVSYSLPAPRGTILKCVGEQGGGWLLVASSRADILPHPTRSSAGRGIISGEGVGWEGVDEDSRWIEGQRNRRRREDADLAHPGDQETSLPPSLLRRSPEAALSPP